MASQSALIKDTFYCRCAKEFEVKSSAKIKKEKERMRDSDRQKL